LYGGTRVEKNDLRVEAYGTIDELVAALGIAVTLIQDNQIRETVLLLQQELFSAGWDLAAPAKADIQRFNAGSILRLEDEIDRYETELPPLRNFILPGGTHASAALHFARCVCRRAERRLVTLMQQETINPEIERYMNRLSDHLFVLARVTAHRAGAEETLWKRP